MTSQTANQSLEPLWRELKNTNFENDPRKEGYLNIIGLLQSDDDPPPLSTKAYERNPFNKFFDLLTEATYFPVADYGRTKYKSELTEEIFKIENMVKERIPSLNETHLYEDNLIPFLRGPDDDPTYEELNKLSLKMFGGHIEHLVLLCTAKNPLDTIKQFIENRYGNIPEEQRPFVHNDPQKNALIQAYSRLSVAPVYVRGSCKFGNDRYFILQLCPKPLDSDGGVSPESLQRLHTTFSIKEDNDHPDEWDDIIGTHKQIRLQGGMQQLVKKEPKQDVIPILLDNSRILSSEETVVWD